MNLNSDKTEFCETDHLYRPVLAENIQVQRSDLGIRYSFEEQILSIKVSATVQQTLLAAFDRTTSFNSWSDVRDKKFIQQTEKALFKKGFLSWQLGLGQTSFITAHATVPQWRAESEAEDNQSSDISQFAIIRFDMGSPRLYNPLRDVSVEILNSEVLSALSMSICEQNLDAQNLVIKLRPIMSEAVAQVTTELISHVMCAKEFENAPEFLWEMPDLLLHTSSRMGLVFREIGPVAKAQYQIPTPPMKIGQNDSDTIERFRASRRKRIDKPKVAPLSSRRSVRTWESPEKQQIIEFLNESLGVQRIVESNSDYSAKYKATWRPHPSGGSMHVLQPYLIINQCDDMESGVYEYCPFEHQITKIRDLLSHDRRQLAFGMRCTGADAFPPIYVSLQANFSRMQWKYQSMAYSTILKDVGAIYQTLYLAALEYDLGVCAIGTGDSRWSTTLVGKPWWQCSSVGELVMGRL